MTFYISIECGMGVGGPWLLLVTGCNVLREVKYPQVILECDKGQNFVEIITLEEVFYCFRFSGEHVTFVTFTEVKT